MLSTEDLMVVWAFFDHCLLSAGIITLIFSIIWKQPNFLLNITFNSINLDGGIGLATLFLTTFVSSLFLVSRHGKTPLIIFNWILLANGIAVVSIGSYMWLYASSERNNYHYMYGMQSDAVKIQIQDTLHCCGYSSAIDEVVLGGDFCPNATVAMAVNNSCVTPITTFADYTLNNILRGIYGFTFIIIGLFLANTCVIMRRQDEERLEKSDVKRAEAGFM